MTTDAESSTRGPTDRPTAVRKALDIFSDSWSFAVLQEMFLGVRRFDDFQRNLQISRSVLTRRLNHLFEQNIIRREVYQTQPVRYEYRLTDRGMDMYAIFVALQRWGEQWLGASGGSFRLVHTPCGHELNPAVVCEHCHKRIDPRDIRYAQD
ncbi:Transcriptional regulator, HxlR family [Sphingobium indicum BiD32]|uniref:Transcriptional regulator, HxlR family n=1 Tax=Sphingobium indicum BiD32 TaxID=1301087 RepID=N1MFU0_9SPHN|nr:helix-turn-helix domain-containing protein [Sphingobium indicum]CCW15831.1 Transcriptional regulator, HxlR family [Sphingobium indicum BiD32]